MRATANQFGLELEEKHETQTFYPVYEDILMFIMSLLFVLQGMRDAAVGAGGSQSALLELFI